MPKATSPTTYTIAQGFSSESLSTLGNHSSFIHFDAVALQSICKSLHSGYFVVSLQTEGNYPIEGYLLFDIIAN